MTTKKPQEEELTFRVLGVAYSVLDDAVGHEASSNIVLGLYITFLAVKWLGTPMAIYELGTVMHLW